MKPDMFKEPVTILVGLGFPAQVRGVTDAYRNLVEWPSSLRDRAHAVALNACQAALRGEIEAETARGFFVGFAQKHDLVTVGTPAVVAARSRNNTDPHVQ